MFEDARGSPSCVLCRNLSAGCATRANENGTVLYEGVWILIGMAKPPCGPLRISTVTGTACLGRVGDLDGLFARIEPSHAITCVRSPDGRRVKPMGSLQTLPRTVGRHLTLVVRVNERCVKCHAKLYENGTVHVTGVKSTSEISEACRIIAGCLAIESNAFDIRTRMINAFFTCVPKPSRRALVDHIRANSRIHASFDPAVSSEARIYFCFDSRISSDPESLAQLDGTCACTQPCAFLPAKLRRCYRVIAIVHSTGTVMMSGGGCSEGHLIRATAILKGFVSSLRAGS